MPNYGGSRYRYRRISDDGRGAFFGKCSLWDESGPEVFMDKARILVMMADVDSPGAAKVDIENGEDARTALSELGVPTF